MKSSTPTLLAAAAAAAAVAGVALLASPASAQLFLPRRGALRGAEAEASEAELDYGWADADERRLLAELSLCMSLGAREGLLVVGDGEMGAYAGGEQAGGAYAKAPKATSAPGLTKAPKAMKAPGAPKATKAPGATKTPKAPGATKAPKAPGLTKAPKATKAPGLTKAPKATKAPGATKAPKARKL